MDDTKESKECLSLYKTTDEQRIRLHEVASLMKQYGLDVGFITSAVEIAEIYEGAFDLFCLWIDETDENERNNIVATLQNEIEEFKVKL